MWASSSTVLGIVSFRVRLWPDCGKTTPCSGASAASSPRRQLAPAGRAGFETYYPGGRRRRGRARTRLAIEPDVLLMDGPFGAPGAQNRRIVQNEVRRI
jgi:ABC-type nitrate/sulfonate/bicarbonate transport system ATPase subunit